MTNLQKIAKKMDMAAIITGIARQGLTSANKKNPFWNKSDAMNSINSAKNLQRQLSKIWINETNVMNNNIDMTIPF